MNIPAKPRRAALLCCHFTRNLAYYHAAWKDGSFLLSGSEFWITVNSNFFDIAVLEWCKLYAEPRAYHSYRKVVADPRHFLPQMYSDFGATDQQWAAYLHVMKIYRDKFIAHLDKQNTMQIPQMDFAQFSINFIYDTMLCEQPQIVFNGLPKSISDYARNCKTEAAMFYADVI